MRWLRWIFAYVFDCVHPHTTWPHRNQTGFAYVCCLDCGRELPYSLESMRIVTRKELLQGQRGLHVLGQSAAYQSQFGSELLEDAGLSVGSE